MNISKYIDIDAHYTRSINIERDKNSIDVINTYILTSRAIETLKSIQKTFYVEDHPRAWTLIGPYGSGKSSFVVFLSHLLGNPEAKTTQKALSVLSRTSNEVMQGFCSCHLDNEEKGKRKGYCKVLITGSPEPFSKAFMRALFEATEDYWKYLNTPLPKKIKLFEKILQQKKITVPEVLQSIKTLQHVVAKEGGSGVLIVIDELGKFLEYEARHPEANDIYLLQALAELAFKKHKAALLIFTSLHQSFEQYAKGLGNTLKNEWSKIQGRFESIPFLETSEQTLRVVSNAIKHDDKLSYTVIRIYIANVVNVLYKNKALPRTLNQEDAIELFKNCYPLHPVSALILPILCQKIAQNERTLFNYLGSQESFGFKESLTRLKQVGDWIYPWEIYEYFIQNQSTVLVDHFTHRRWAEVVTAVDRFGDEDINSVYALKAIGLLNIIGSHAGLKASTDIIETCLPQKKSSIQACQLLLKRSIIQFRKYNNEYRVWEGSDFNLDAEIEKERNRLGQFSIAEYLNNQHIILPVIARRFTIETGTLRFFQPVFTDHSSIASISKAEINPRIIFYISEDKEDSRSFKGKFISTFSPSDVIAEFHQTENFRMIISEVFALKTIQQKSQVLHSDPIAQRELKDRLSLFLQKEKSLFASLIDHPEQSDWYWQQKKLKIQHRRALQEKLSTILHKVFKNTPIIKNELINRNKPSAQAVAGRNKLLKAMLLSQDKKDLGIEKFPPEKAIYRAILRETGIHAFIDGEWKYKKPEKTSNIFQTWSAMTKFLESTENKARAFLDLKEILIKAPYGVKEGILPILYLSLYVVHKDEVALYEEGRYISLMTQEILERFVKVPDVFTVQLFRIGGRNAFLFKAFVEALFPDEKPKTVVQAIRPLAQFIGNLDEYTQKTKNLSKETIAFRKAFNFSKSPENLLFKDIPSALGYTKESGYNLIGYKSSIVKATKELKFSYQNMLDEEKQWLAQAFHRKLDIALAELRYDLSEEYNDIIHYTVDTDSLKAFVIRLVDQQESNDEWLEKLLMFLANKHPKKWLDTDKKRAEIKLKSYAARLLDLSSLRLQTQKNEHGKNKNFDTIMLKTIKKGGQEYVSTIIIDSAKHDLILSLKQEFKLRLSQEDRETQLAVVAELTNDYLKDAQKNKLN